MKKRDNQCEAKYDRPANEILFYPCGKITDDRDGLAEISFCIFPKGRYLSHEKPGTVQGEIGAANDEFRQFDSFAGRLGIN